MTAQLRFLVFQHLEVEHPGMFREYWREAGIETTVVELDAGDTIPPLEAFDALVVMGGPMDTWQVAQHPWLLPEHEAIREFVAELAKPYLGICLGHQLLASALGGRVQSAATSEVGPSEVELTQSGADDPLLAGLSSPLLTFQWHSSEVALPPPGAVVLARSDRCEVQAIRYGDVAYGLQFHAELTAATVGEWREVAEYRASLEQTLGLEGAAGLEDATARLLPRFNHTARTLSDNFLKLVRARADAA